MLGGALAVLSAALFGLSVASVRRGILNATILQGLSITVPVGVPLFLIGALATGQIRGLADYSATSVGLLVVAGLVHFIWGRYCNYRAIRAIGANLVSPIQPLGLVLGLSLAVGLLGEAVTPLRLFGIGLVILGPMIALRDRKRRNAAATPPGSFQPRYLEGYVFALLSATAYGLSPVIIRAVFAATGGGVGAGLTGGLISYSAAAVAIGLFLLLPGRLAHVTSISRSSAPWFALSGGVVCLSQMARFAALAIAPVTVVAPLVQTAGIFRPVFGWLLNRQHELFGRWVLAGIAVSLLGAVALTVGTETVLSLVTLPDPLADFLRWQWSVGRV